MKLYNLITTYHHDGSASNPLISVHLTTTDDDLAKANLERMVASEMKEGWERSLLTYAGNHYTLKKDGAILNIALILTTSATAFTHGRSIW